MTRFQTYFPHVDNVYSHRSTQRHKRHAFVSHYWDCRLIGRPSGTPKSDDPAKKKRKRVARQRDLCHVKIKIVERFAGADAGTSEAGAGRTGGSARTSTATAAAAGAPRAALGQGQGENAGRANGKAGGKTYEISMVSGTDPNNFIGTLFSAHEHTLEDSDRIKKNSVIRHFMALEKEVKEQSVSLESLFPLSCVFGSFLGLLEAARSRNSKQRNAARGLHVINAHPPHLDSMPLASSTFMQSLCYTLLFLRTCHHGFRALLLQLLPLRRQPPV